MLQNEIEYLKQQIETKDEHIGTLKSEGNMLHGLLQKQQETNNELTRLLENSQVLLKHEQEKNTLLLESSEVKKVVLESI